jgi:hypothetical protein
LVPLGAGHLEELEAVHPRHLEVGDDEIHRLAPEVM